jgi:hypothetical protein
MKATPPRPSRRADRRLMRRSRQAAKSSAQIRRLAAQDRRPRSGTPSPVCVAAIVRDTPDLSAALRLCARQTPRPRPPPARRADRRHTRTGRAEPQSRRALTSGAIVGDIQTVGAGRPAPSVSRRSSETPQISLRLCASARDKHRRHDHHPLDEPIADTPEQVAQSRRAAERSPQARSSGTSRPSEREA